MPKKVVVYTSDWCPFCHQAKALLDRKGVAYEEVNLERDPKLREEVVRRSGQRTVPQVFIDDEPYGGYSELAALDRQGRLDEILGVAS